MEWTAHWDWNSNLDDNDAFRSKPIQTPEPNIYWEMEDEGDIDAAAASLNFSADCAAASAGSTSDISISASTHHSSSKEKLLLLQEEEEERIKASHFTFVSTDCNANKHCSGAELSATSSSLEEPSNELLIGLKLGKRTYFENTTNAAYFSVLPPVSSPATSKRIRSTCQNSTTPRCIVQGCNLDISSAKDYHRKHKICEIHSKAPKVVVGGLERRFCQQCSRFHSLSDFDENKRSCRRRLSDHNARRRKPHQDTIQFNSSSLASSTFGPSCALRTFRSKNTEAKGHLLKTEKAVVVDDLQSHLLGIQLPHAVSNPNSNTLLQCMGSTEASNQGFKESMLSFNLDAAPDLHRALSLLSTNSWGSREPEYVHPNHSMNVTPTSMPQYVIHSVSQGFPNAPSEYWQAEVQSSNAHMHALAANSSSSSHYQEIQLLTLPYDSEFYSNPLN